MNQRVAMQEFRRGLEMLQHRCPEQAVLHLERAFRIDSENPYFVSYMGLATGVARRQWAEAESLCQKAVKLRRDHPVFYLNLAEVYRRTGRREDAVSALQRGLLNTQNSPLLKSAIGKLMPRHRPLLPFLKRNHVMNRKLGELRHQMAQLLRP